MREKNSILVVAHREEIAARLSDELGDAYTLQIARSVAEAESALDRDGFDAVISEQQLQEVTGIEFYSQIDLARHPNLGKILIGADITIDEALLAINHHLLDKVIDLPWEKQNLIQTVNSVVSGRAAAEHRFMKKIETELGHVEKMASLGELAAGIIHEINNPLSFVSSNLNKISKCTLAFIGLIETLERGSLPQDIRELVDKKKEEINYAYFKERIPYLIERSINGVKMMKDIVQDIKLCSGSAATEEASADINELLERAIAMTKHEHKNRIAIQKDLGGIPSTICRATEISQVFINLLVNACQAMDAKGAIHLTTRHDGENITIEMSDTGPGIPKEIISKIFDPFFTTKPAQQGTGLGLAVSYRIIKNHDGEITVESDKLKGTTFTITLPIRSR